MILERISWQPASSSQQVSRRTLIRGRSPQTSRRDFVSTRTFGGKRRCPNDGRVRNENASNLVAQKKTPVTARTRSPRSNVCSLAESIAGLYQRLENPRIFSSRGITSRVVFFWRQRQIGAPSLVSSVNPSFRNRAEKSTY